MILFESSRDNLLQPYVELYNSKVTKPEDKTNVSQMKQYLLRKFVNEALIRNLSLDSNYYLAGVARYYFHGDLTANKKLNIFNPEIKDEFKEDVCKRLNAVIVVLRNAYIDTVGQTFEQPEDFGTLSIARLLRKYNKAINAELGNEPAAEETAQAQEMNRDNNVGNGYTFEILYNYADARKYESYTRPGAWCITYADFHFNGYVRDLNIHYVIFRKNGFENVERKMGADCPRDEYGDSLIALLQSNKTGEPKYITSRWNHGSSDTGRLEADHAYTKEQFMQITGVSEADLKRIYEIWKTDAPTKTTNSQEDDGPDRKALNAEYKKALRVIKYGQMKLNSGMLELERTFDNGHNRILGGYNTLEELEAAHPNNNREGDTYLVNGDRYVWDGTNWREKNIVKYKFLSNKKKMEEILADTTNKPNKKAIQKLWKNSVTAMEITVDDYRYYFLVDRGKIIFDTVRMLPENWQLNWIAESNETFCCLGSPRASGVNGKYMFYHIPTHKLVTIDGINKFKYVKTKPFTFGEKALYYLFGDKVNKWAMIDTSTGEPLVLPNGAVWMENVSPSGIRRWDFRRTDDVHAIGTSDCVVSIDYDSSAGIKYCFLTKEKKFFTPPDGYYVPNSNAIRALADYGVYNLDNRYENSIKFYQGDKPFSALPDEYSTSRVRYDRGSIREQFCFVVLREYYKDREYDKIGNPFLYDAKTNKTQFLDIPEASSTDFITVRGDFIKVLGGEKEPVAFLEFAQYAWSNNYPGALIYSLKRREFIKNPINGELWFDNFSKKYTNRPNPNFSERGDENNCSFWYNMNILTLGHDVPYCLNGDGKLVAISESQIQQQANESKVHFTENDIKKMVSECVRRILKKR